MQHGHLYWLGCRSVASVSEVSFFFHLLIFGMMALHCRGRDARHGVFVALQSQHSEGERGKGQRLRTFLSPSDLAAKHVSDPTGVPQLPSREPKFFVLTNFPGRCSRLCMHNAVGPHFWDTGCKSYVHARRLRERGMVTRTAASAVRGSWTVAAPDAVMTSFFLIVCASFLQWAHIHVTYSVTPRSHERSRRIRRGFGECLRGRSKTFCSQFPDLCAFG